MPPRRPRCSRGGVTCGMRGGRSRCSRHFWRQNGSCDGRVDSDEAVAVLKVLTVLKVLVLPVLMVPVRADASERYALIITGALGEPTYAEQYAQWRQQAVTALLEKLAVDERKVFTL